MATPTPNFSFDKPTVGADSDIWGGFLNGNWDSVDSILAGGTPITPDINGGTIDGATIGGTVAAEGSFTNVSASGTLNVTGASTVAALTASGAITVSNGDPTLLLADTDLTDAVASISAPNGYLRFNTDVNNVASLDEYLFLVSNVEIAALSPARFNLPVGNNAARPATPAAGDIRFNSETGSFEGYNGGAWVNLDSAPPAQTYFEEFHDPTGVASYKIIGETLTCWGFVSTTGNVPTVTFPKTFADALYNVTGIIEANNSSTLVAKFDTPTTTTMRVRVVNENDSTVTGKINWSATGKWDGVS